MGFWYKKLKGEEREEVFFFCILLGERLLNFGGGILGVRLNDFGVCFSEKCEEGRDSGLGHSEFWGKTSFD